MIAANAVAVSISRPRVATGCTGLRPRPKTTTENSRVAWASPTATAGSRPASATRYAGAPDTTYRRFSGRRTMKLIMAPTQSASARK